MVRTRRRDAGDVLPGAGVQPLRRCPARRARPQAANGRGEDGMKKINFSKVPVVKWTSPKGKFGISSQEPSYKLGRRGVPFELERVIVPPGKASFPYHLHSTEW